MFARTLLSLGISALLLIPQGQPLLAAEPSDLVLTDVEMPAMDGRALLERLSVLAPAMASRTLVMTGGSGHAALQEWVARLDPQRVIHKPMNHDVAITILRAVTNGSLRF